MILEIKMAATGAIETVDTGDKTLQQLMTELNKDNGKCFLFTDLKGREIIVNMGNFLTMRKK